MTWREKARPIIEQALRDGRAQGLEARELRKFIDARYPWGPRENHPYQVWCDEVRVQMGTKTKRVEHTPDDVPGQGKLFQ